MNQLVSILSTIKNNVCAYIVPSICAYCRKFLLERASLCTVCKEKIFPIVSKKIDVTQKISVTVFAISDYKDPLKKLILAKSWFDIVASYQMADLLWQYLPLEQLDYDVIVPVPLHWIRYAWRGFNQAEEIARGLQKKKKIPLVFALKRIKRTVFQSTLTSNMRVENLKEAFELNGVAEELIKDKHILLVDDLMTTGSTIASAVKKLWQLQPRKITVVVVCRVI